MGIVGNLRTMQLEEVLQWLSQSKKSGTLQFNSGKVEKKVFFKEGRILSSSSNVPEEYLGHFLVSHGLITEEVLTKAVRMQEETRMLLGKILVTNGAIEEPQLRRMLHLKAEESIYDIFAWEEGEFRFLDDELPANTMVPMNLDVTAIVMEGVQRVDEWRRIRKLIPHTQVIPVSTADLLDDPKLDPGARLILELVDDQRTIAEIQVQTHSSEYHVCRMLFEQYQKKRLKLIQPRWNPGADSAAPASPAAAATSAAPGAAAPTSAATLLKAAQGYLQQVDYDQALRHLRAARSLEPDNKEMQDALREGEKVTREGIERAGVTLTSIPKLAVSMEQLTQLKISPQEGFMLTRINGTYDIQSIVKITPMPQLDALLVFWKLLAAGYIKVENKR